MPTKNRTRRPSADPVNDRAVAAYDAALAKQKQASAQITPADVKAVVEKANAQAAAELAHFPDVEIDVDKITFDAMEALEGSTKFKELRTWLLVYTNLTNERINALSLTQTAWLVSHIQHQVKLYISGAALAQIEE